jgi:hypothetical protein
MPKEDLAQLYCGFLEEIKTRLALVSSVVEGGVSTGSNGSNYELIAVNLRKVLELIAFGSLSANKEVYATAHGDFAKHWSAKRLLDKLEKLHPDFYPKPVHLEILKPGPPRHFHFDFVSDDFLTREKFVELYDVCSSVIHTRNPFAEAAHSGFIDGLPLWVFRIELLLRLHLMRLAGTSLIWLVELNAPGDRRAHAYVAGPTSP